MLSTMLLRWPMSFHHVVEDIEAACITYKDGRFQWAQEVFDSSKVHRAMVT